MPLIRDDIQGGLVKSGGSRGVTTPTSQRSLAQDERRRRARPLSGSSTASRKVRVGNKTYDVPIHTGITQAQIDKGLKAGLSKREVQFTLDWRESHGWDDTPVPTRPQLGASPEVTAYHGPAPKPSKDVLPISGEQAKGIGELGAAGLKRKYPLETKGLEKEYKAAQKQNDFMAESINPITSLYEPAAKTVVGMGPGLFLAGRALERDARAVAHGDKPTHFYEDIAKPIGQSYARKYGPAVHGDWGTTAERIREDPIGSALDIGSIVSAGAGTTARLSEASRGAAVGRALTARRGEYMTSKQIEKKLSPAVRAIVSPMSAENKWRMYGFLNPEHRGSLLEMRERRKSIDYAAEHEEILKDVMSVLEDPNSPIGRRSIKQVMEGVKADLKATRVANANRPVQMQRELPGHVSLGTAKVASKLTQTMHEVLDFVRVGAIYLRPAYLPNNWAGNTFMGLVHQGFLAPINLGKSLVLEKRMDPRLVHAIDAGMQQHAAQAAMGYGKGYVRSITQPLVHFMGAVADQPFRRAAFLHEARRQGYRAIAEVEQLMKRVRAGNPSAADKFANISRMAQEEIVKFGKLSEQEQGVAKNIFFVYNWMRGATRYTARFPFQHPITANVLHHTAMIGGQWAQTQMGGVPWFMAGAIPVGRKPNGDPILIDPFALNPLGTGVQVARAAKGTYDVLQDPSKFNKFADTDIADLTNPVVSAYLKSREGQGAGMTEELKKSIAPLRLYEDLKHPGRGSIYPMTRREALGHYIFGSLYPRHASQAALTRALEREQADNPVALFGTQYKDYLKQGGKPLPPREVASIRADIEADVMLNKFQKKYAQDHGSSGFKSMPPANRATAALEFLDKYTSIPNDRLAQLRSAVTKMPNDTAMNELANALWNMTGIGEYKNAWESIRGTTKSKELTPARG